MVQNTEPVFTDFTYITERDGSENDTCHSCVLDPMFVFQGQQKLKAAHFL